MTELHGVRATALPLSQAYEWMGAVLHHFAEAEHALGKLSLFLDLPIENGSLASLNEVRNRLQAVKNRKCNALDNKIAGWSELRPLRHLLAHASVRVLFTEGGETVVVTRHLPRDKNDVTPERTWSEAERAEMLKKARSDGHSICAHVRDLLSDSAKLDALRSA